ncbi:class D sortase [Siminovitchia sp. 179-K 8D1 HS]|uniref:class D sortase n=1 Tax=Siminovitchia sp. 179-K 8D1 HS TaxID=3142385 RepID=UPI0039A3EBB6
MKRFILLAAAVGMIGFGVWLSGTNAFKFTAGYMLFQAEKAGSEPDAVEPEKPAPVVKKRETKTVVYHERPAAGEKIGDLYIPKLEATLPIYHGTDEDELEKGVGHYAGSVLPGENDNSVLSGHRDTVFRRLGEVGKDDLLIVTTSAGEFTYKIRKVRIVDADDRTVIVPKPRPTLTVTTCYPFRYIGDAPERYILIGDLIESKKTAS